MIRRPIRLRAVLGPGAWQRARDWLDQRNLLSAWAVLAAAFVIFLLSCLAGGHTPGTAASGGNLPGFGFAAGAVISAGSVRREDLLIVVTAPPVLFVIALTCAELISAWLPGGLPVSAGSEATAIFLTLSTAAIWLFAGFTAALILALIRGLRQCVRDLRTGLSGLSEPGGLSRTSGAGRTGARQAAAAGVRAATATARRAAVRGARRR